LTASQRVAEQLEYSDWDDWMMRILCSNESWNICSLSFMRSRYDCTELLRRKIKCNNTVFWVVTARSSEITWRFGGTDHLQLQSRRVSQRRDKKNKAASLANHLWKIPPNLSQQKPESNCEWPTLSPDFTLVSCSAYSTLRMESICSSLKALDFQRSTQRYIPGDTTLQPEEERTLDSHRRD
jgi:hypothetical protein